MHLHDALEGIDDDLGWRGALSALDPENPCLTVFGRCSGFMGNCCKPDRNSSELWGPNHMPYTTGLN